MAGDWIKMRGELFTHPRFITLCGMLIEGENPGLLVYSCGSGSMGRAVEFQQNHAGVTDVALLGVTRQALCDVTMSALLRVWCAVNSHCKVDGDDAVMCPMDISELDRIAGFDGFGEAMKWTGWVKAERNNSLRFPNFLEFNEPSCLRRPAKTSAERQRDFRLRHAVKKTVTKSNGCNDREEKRREDIDTSNDVSRTRAKFVKPTLEELTAYCQSRANHVDPGAFLSHYESNGWRVGKNPMKDWKAAVHTWERNGYQANGSNGKPQASSTAIADYDVLCCEVRRVGAGQIPSYPNQASRDAVKAMGGWSRFCSWDVAQVEWRRKAFLEHYR